MEKIDVVLVALNRELLESAVKILNRNNANLVAIIADNNDEEFFQVGAEKIPLVPFSGIQQPISKHRYTLWLIKGYVNDPSDIDKTKNFLMAHGIPENNIVNFEISSQISPTWLANLRYVEDNGADFFATGNEYMQTDLNFKFIPCTGGVNLADVNQDLRQSYLTAKYIFEHVTPRSIKFVLIGLTPDSFRYDNAKDFSACSRNFQYSIAMKVSERTLHDSLLKNLVGKFTMPAAQADLNFDALKSEQNRKFTASSVAGWKRNDQFSADVAENFQTLKNYIKLCLDNGAKPVGVVFPVTQATRNSYNSERLTEFREKIRELEESYGFICFDFFDLKLDYDCFSDMTHLNSKGSLIANALLALKLYTKNLIPAENFCNATYAYLNVLSNVATKDEFNAFIEKVFEVSAKEISKKDKIEVGFVIYDASMWCGDELYNYFAQDKRFNTKIFLCLRTDKAKDEMVKEDFLRGVEQFKSRGLNVFALDNRKAAFPAQDLLISLTPYLGVLPVAFRPANIKAKTLIVYVSYALGVSKFNAVSHAIFRTAWKLFFPSAIKLESYKKTSKIGMPRGFYSGHPKTDVFFRNDVESHFDWKIVRPDAKKIIWAPHWTIKNTVKYATFQWNYKFMYEFAKAHPEISWLVKPHPNLLFSAVSEKIFSSVKEFKEYLQKWDDLPNAQVYTGAYYQGIFATSDGMIHDSGSFIAEYQFVDKPMIFLTREGEKFNKLGNEILKASYLVSGKDLDKIAALMQKVFIEGDDSKATERREIFDKYLNYPKYNGMLASEFIYRSIADGLTEEKI